MARWLTPPYFTGRVFLRLGTVSLGICLDVRSSGCGQAPGNRNQCSVRLQGESGGHMEGHGGTQAFIVVPSGVRCDAHKSPITRDLSRPLVYVEQCGEDTLTRAITCCVSSARGGTPPAPPHPFVARRVHAAYPNSFETSVKEQCCHPTSATISGIVERCIVGAPYHRLYWSICLCIYLPTRASGVGLTRSLGKFGGRVYWSVAMACFSECSRRLPYSVCLCPLPRPHVLSPDFPLSPPTPRCALSCLACRICFVHRGASSFRSSSPELPWVELSPSSRTCFYPRALSTPARSSCPCASRRALTWP